MSKFWHKVFHPAAPDYMHHQELFFVLGVFIGFIGIIAMVVFFVIGVNLSLWFLFGIPLGPLISRIGFVISDEFGGGF